MSGQIKVTYVARHGGTSTAYIDEDTHRGTCKHSGVDVQLEATEDGWRQVDDWQWTIDPLGEFVRVESAGTVWRDRDGDDWTVGDDDLMHSYETRPFPRAHVERKWGPLVELVPESSSSQTPTDTTGA